jgi:hypothetical protein
MSESLFSHKLKILLRLLKSGHCIAGTKNDKLLPHERDRGVEFANAFFLLRNLEESWRIIYPLFIPCQRISYCFFNSLMISFCSDFVQPSDFKYFLMREYVFSRAKTGKMLLWTFNQKKDYLPPLFQKFALAKSSWYLGIGCSYFLRI